jgi:hypothetical protein
MSMSRQDMFDKAYIALMRQGFQAVVPESEGQCQYRTSTGTRCAIGHLLPDSLIDRISQSNNSNNVRILMKLYSEVDTLLGGLDNIAFLTRLQECHDFLSWGGLSFCQEFDSSMRKLAVEYKLTVPQL